MRCFDCIFIYNGCISVFTMDVYLLLCQRPTCGCQEDKGNVEGGVGLMDDHLSVIHQARPFPLSSSGPVSDKAEKSFEKKSPLLVLPFPPFRQQGGQPWRSPSPLRCGTPAASTAW